MLVIVRTVFGLIASALAIYALLTESFEVLPIMILFLGAMFMVMGISELQEKGKAAAYPIFLISGFSLFISIYLFF
ncbi:DUF3953 domain-containing protein [Bacillus massiliglaciei]|uniref:DUF3953 domain-containing protein n=1 Tax=Bacillus massiliglaciei TaxID=1816693 RepID=UPI001F2E8BF4|nr:DUF3953 domain-containing protein [Bacillus massiliglaciei]